MSFRFSVITPSFRQGRFIDRTIQSVLSQNFSNIEYVICDGGSDDETLDILKQYGDRIRWISEPDRGQADAVNKGITMTTGEIIAWINSDDIYYPEAFEVIDRIFKDNPEIQIVYGQADWIDEEDKILQAFPTETWNYRHLIETCYLCQPAVFFKRSLIEKLGYLNTSLEYCMDYELWLRYGEYTKFYYLTQKLAGSRMYPTNKTVSKRLAAHYEIVEMIKNKFGKIPDAWLLGYALVKVEETTNLNRFDDSQVTVFTKALIWNSFLTYRHFHQVIPLLVITKMIFWLFFPNLSWFRRSILSYVKNSN